jgi:hypothetical protein
MYQVLLELLDKSCSNTCYKMPWKVRSCRCPGANSEHSAPIYMTSIYAVTLTATELCTSSPTLAHCTPPRLASPGDLYVDVIRRDVYEETYLKNG